MTDSLKNENDNLPAKPGGFTRFRKEWLEPIVIAFALAFLIRSFVLEPFKIPSGSMEDTLLVGDQFMAAKFLYGIRMPFGGSFLVRYNDPSPGDVIVFKYPEDPSKDYIKRCVAVEGQTIEIRDKEVFVDGVRQDIPEHAKFTDSLTYGRRDNMPPTVVPDDCMFVMGDNRDNSHDSRFWGFVPYENIVGKALFVWWSWNTNVPLFDLLHRARWSRFFTLIR